MIRRKLTGYARIERRRDRRQSIDLNARIGDHAATIVDISLGGLRAAACVARSPAPRAYRLGELHRIRLEIPSYGTLELSAVIARIDTAEQFVGLRFVDLDFASYRIIERLAIGRSVPAMRA